MDTWGVYERKTTNLRTKEETTDNVTLQADPVNRARFEAKGFTFKNFVPIPGSSAAVGLQATVGQSASEQMFGLLPNKYEDLDQNEIVKQAAEVALRKITGTWTQAEAEAETAAHLKGQYKPEETPFAIVQGDPLEGYEKLMEKEGSPAQGTVGPGGTVPGSYPVATPPPPVAGVDGSGVDGSGAVAPVPPPPASEPTPAP